MTPPARRLFVAGSTGATGRALLSLLPPDLPCVAHRRSRPGRDRGGEPAGVTLTEADLSDPAALAAAMQGCTTAVQLIGTVRSRFGSGDTYQSSDIQTTAQLVAGAQRAGVDHLILLSSVGAGQPAGPYLRAKAEAEAIALGSGIPCTVLRPSAFIGDRHTVPPLVEPLCRWIGLHRYRPIRLDQLAGAILRAARDRGPLGVLEGAGLWEIVGQG